jgi:multiple sugar transport system permease protein
MRSVMPHPRTTGSQPKQGQHRLVARTLREKVVPRIFLLAMAILFLIPLYWMVITAFKTPAELTSIPPTIWPRSFRWQNFVDAVSAIPFGQYFVNTVIITGLSTIGAVVSNMLIAYGFACIKWPGRDFVFYLVIATIFIPFPIVAVPLFDMFASLHWVNTFLPLIVPAFFGNAFFIFLLRQFLLQVPQEMLEAARIDGAHELQIMYRVIMPMVRPALAAVAIFAMIAAWNDFLGPLIYLQDDSKRTLAIGLQFFRSLHDVQLNLLMAASVLVILPVIILFILFQRYFIEGVTIGSIR